MDSGSTGKTGNKHKSCSEECFHEGKYLHRREEFKGSKVIVNVHLELYLNSPQRPFLISAQ